VLVIDKPGCLSRAGPGGDQTPVAASRASRRRREQGSLASLVLAIVLLFIFGVAMASQSDYWRGHADGVQSFERSPAYDAEGCISPLPSGQDRMPGSYSKHNRSDLYPMSPGVTFRPWKEGYEQGPGPAQRHRWSEEAQMPGMWLERTFARSPGHSIRGARELQGTYLGQSGAYGRDRHGAPLLEFSPWYGAGYAAGTGPRRFRYRPLEEEEIKRAHEIANLVSEDI
jgi:hypothetical protein